MDNSSLHYKEKIKQFLPGFIMGFARSIISHPFEILKLKSQLNFNKQVFYKNLHSGLHLSILSTSIERGFQFYFFNEIHKHHNLLYSSLFASFISTSISLPYNLVLIKNLLTENYNKPVFYNGNIFLKSAFLEYKRNLSGSTIFLYTYNRLKENYPIYVSGIFSSFLVWTITYPIDTIKNQIICGNKLSYDIKSLYKGVQYPLMRSIPSSVVGLYIYEYLIKNL